MTRKADRVLVIEDDPSGLEMALFNLRKAGYQAEGAPDGEAGLGQFDAARHALVITDVKMPGLSGLEVLARIKADAPDTPVIVITAYGDVDMAVGAMKAGAFDFIGKPFNRDHLLLVVDKALQRRRLEDEVRALRRRTAGVERPIVAASDAMARVLDVADRVAGSDAGVLITGETGTGKELVARRIHARSARADQPFVAVNCAAIPAELLESELFGHVRGAFTGAARDRRGRFRQAHGGTLFLDEVAEFPTAVQAKLLRALQEGSIDVVGAERAVRVDVRVVVATNRDLSRRVAEGAFREDLFYRLNVVDVAIPPLRERTEDIEPLARHFVERFAAGRELEIPDALLAAMRARPWPGNVRELENACERLVVLCRGEALDPADLPGLAETASGGALDDWPALPDGGLSLVDLERRVIERVLDRTGGNVSAAARYLGVPRHILTYRIAKHGLGRDDG